MDTNGYIAFLVLGAILVAIDGQIIYRSGRRYLEHSYGDAESGKSMTRLVTVLFHLAILGLLMLVSTVDVGGDNLVEGVITRLGIMLLLVAVAHGLTVVILTRIRDKQMQERLAEEMGGHLPGTPRQTQAEPTVGPPATAIDSPPPPTTVAPSTPPTATAPPATAAPPATTAPPTTTAPAAPFNPPPPFQAP